MEKSLSTGVAKLNIWGRGTRATSKVYKSTPMASQAVTNTGVQCKLQDLKTTITIDQ